MTKRQVSVTAVMALSLSVGHAQDRPDLFDAAVALPKAWAILTTAIEAGEPLDRHGAVTAFADAGTPRALDVIERIARDKSHPLRGVAVLSLPNTDATYLAIVADALQDPDLATRRYAIEQLGRIGDPATLPHLQGVMLSGDAATIIAWLARSSRLAALTTSLGASWFKRWIAPTARSGSMPPLA